MSAADIRLPVGLMNALTVKRHSRSLSLSLTLSFSFSFTHSLFLSSPNTSEFTQNTVNKTSLFSRSGQQRMADSDLNLVYHGLLLPKINHTEESLNYLQNFQVKDDDVFAVTYPKSGTTWMQEILPPLLNGGDLTSVETIPNWDRVPWLEETRASVVLDKLPSPRAIVSHMPYNLMPSSFFKSKAKVQKAAEQSSSKAKHMKTNKMSNYSLVPENIMDNKKSPFLRKGIAGDWKNHFSPELDAKFTAVIQEEMKGSNIKFPWDE
ncbi:sulfotransferase family cytosolic 2B member 1-like [Sinocyclocheilus rhinocerous]|uniref:sulfotransferase family cytosolic 2B member 1-like n=1 Tax=Sinocyclocheilus rhinocerous TaxID=307959 RepID=UPI0007B8749A|nr:PREDICTED: sulfotransferase family cytosolic 2B member 1-like [Sinocyclocheilus rhinocerous]